MSYYDLDVPRTNPIQWNKLWWYHRSCKPMDLPSNHYFHRSLPQDKGGLSKGVLGVSFLETRKQWCKN